MYYRVERTFLTTAQGESEQSLDPRPYLSSGATSSEAALAFIEQDSATLLGSISSLPGDKSLATARVDGRLYVIFVQRGAETLQFASDLKPRDAKAARRTDEESSDNQLRSPRR
jgi:hypothetical protein